MKKYYYIILVTIIAYAIIFIFILGPGKNEFLFSESKQQDSITSSSSDILNELYFITLNRRQFEGLAFIGTRKGPCNMLITKNNQGDYILNINYAIVEYPTEIINNVNETYIITNLTAKSAVIEDYGVNNAVNYADKYLWGNVTGLSATTNSGSSKNYSSTGVIKFFIDNVDFLIDYVISMEGGNWSYQGSISLNQDNYSETKSFFDSLKVPEPELEYEYQQIVSNFIKKVKKDKKEDIAEMVNYPFARGFPLMDIKTKSEFVIRYNEFFDDSLKQLIINSNPATDWFASGWRGIFSREGGIKISYDGIIMDIYYQSKYEKKLIADFIGTIKRNIHPSLSDFYKPIFVLETSKYRIRIDDLGNENYRYAAWPLNKSMKEKPNIVIENGERINEGSGGDHKYVFKNSNYIYECYINVLGGNDEVYIPPATLEIFQDGKSILNQNATITTESTHPY